MIANRGEIAPAAPCALVVSSNIATVSLYSTAIRPNGCMSSWPMKAVWHRRSPKHQDAYLNIAPKTFIAAAISRGARIFLPSIRLGFLAEKHRFAEICTPTASPSWGPFCRKKAIPRHGRQGDRPKTHHLQTGSGGLPSYDHRVKVDGLAQGFPPILPAATAEPWRGYPVMI